MQCIDQSIGEQYAIYNGDCVEVLKGLPDHSMHYSIFSPPFASLYTYSNSPRDMGNCRSDAEFFEHFGYLIDELLRVMMPGRDVSFHCMLMPTSKVRKELARILLEEGWIAGYHEEPGEPATLLVVELKYGPKRERVISGLKRVSKPGRRIYASRDRLPRVLSGLGTAVVSTSSGMLTASDAGKRGVGGEVLCFIW